MPQLEPHFSNPNASVKDLLRHKYQPQGANKSFSKLLGSLSWSRLYEHTYMVIPFPPDSYSLGPSDSRGSQYVILGRFVQFTVFSIFMAAFDALIISGQSSFTQGS